MTAPQQKNFEKKAEIYGKALELFVKEGYDATSMSMIADSLGMSKANLYYYCSSKENLLYQIHLDFLTKRFLPILNEAEAVSDPAERVALFLRKFTLLNTSSRANRILVHEVHRLDEGHQKEIEIIWRRAYQIVRDSIRELQESGKVQKFRDSFLTFMWVGMVFWVVYWFDYGRQEEADELADAISQTFLDTLRDDGFKTNRKLKNNASGAG
jgi:TetR/AcrR family transcriptional regulator, cholesterol catabolism regulator